MAPEETTLDNQATWGWQKSGLACRAQCLDRERSQPLLSTCLCKALLGVVEDLESYKRGLHPHPHICIGKKMITWKIK